MQNLKGIGGLLKSITNVTRTVNDATRTAKNVKSTTQDVSRTVGIGVNKNPKPVKPKKDDSWTCGCGVTNTTKFCGGCGKPAPAPLKCPKCKWVRPAENSSMKFCGNCGTQLEE